jgi:hypothetical protein
VVSANGLGDTNFTYGGPGFVVSVLSGGGPPPPPARGCATAAAGTSAHAGRAPSALICQAGSWGQTVDFVGLRPGGDAVGASPPLGNSTTASVTVGGLTKHDKEVLVDEVAGRLLRGKRVTLKAACLLEFREAVTELPRTVTLTESEFQDKGFQVAHYLLNLVACLDVARALDASRGLATAAQAPTCGLTAFGVTVQARRGRPAQVRVTAGGAPNGPLHVTCVPSQGQIELTVATRTAGVPLSRFVGPRLQIGIVRSRLDQPGGQVAFRFDRP